MTQVERQVGRYRLEEVIGTGAFAAVHRATDERLQDTVAVKVLGDNHCESPDVRERFIAEGRLLRRLDSPHIVRVHDIGETDHRQPFLVLEYADRGSLAQRVAALQARGWRPGAADLLVLTRSLAAAVEALHKAALVHRDLSPGNVLLRSTVAPQGDYGAVLVSTDERLLVADLGLCKDLARHSGLTQAGGTDGFRPPEQCGGLGQVDQRADLWALSALVVWLATGAPPGQPGVAADVALAGFPKGLGKVLARSLADETGRRHPDVAAWLAEVEAALLPPTATPAPPTPGAGRRAGPEPRTDAFAAAVRDSPAPARLGRFARLAAILVAGALLGAGATFLRDSGSDSTSVRRVEGNRIEAVQESAGARVAIVGPASVPTGRVATFEAETENLVQWAWFMPDGLAVPDAPQVEVRAVEAGSARISLLGVTASGDRLEAVYDLEIVDE